MADAVAGSVESIITKKPKRASVFSTERYITNPTFNLPATLKANEPLRMDGRNLLAELPDSCSPIVFLDPQYRGILEKLNYGNEGKSRCVKRSELKQMSDSVICNFASEINRILIPSGHLFLWIDKFHFCTGFQDWLSSTDLNVVDLITWSKCRIGMGYRTRRSCEYLVVLQKTPVRAKGVWRLHNIPDVWAEKVTNRSHAHCKPIKLQKTLIEAVSNPGDFVVDPAAGSFSVLDACVLAGRNFIGCDLV